MVAQGADCIFFFFEVLNAPRFFEVLSVPFFSWIRTNMIHQPLDLFLCILIFCFPFGDHLPDEFMIALTMALLVAVHRVTVEYTALDL